MCLVVVGITVGSSAGIAAGAALAGWLVLFGILAALTDPRRVAPGPRTLELGGNEPPAVTTLLGGPALIVALLSAGSAIALFAWPSDIEAPTTTTPTTPSTSAHTTKTPATTTPTTTTTRKKDSNPIGPGIMAGFFCW